ncbi:hypothetical protein M408DRAFT_30021 [Serendipita vermifera MAFF 305830]|uniref:TECPR1-like DysF domain-containing protein n=1 Tax=Serendipita vermifera MAFF 305830 TaxID=933852 RepID=A0A0C3ANM6_SERVB|nr:hypothetical protein M408DRAFT_30021 [Serendipita vermifera MAFF 305830]
MGSKKNRDDEEGDVIAEAREEAEAEEARPSRTRPSRSITNGSVKLEALIQVEHDLSMQKVLYRYAEVYENQRGWARLGYQTFSSRALNLFFHYKDPAPFTKYERTENGVQQVDLPYTSLNDVQLPSAEWTWHGPEWLVDMAGDGVTSYDGFQYNTHFRPKGWRPVAPKWHAYFLTCVRRRRWLRLMVYLPSLVSADAKGMFHPPSHIPAASEPPSPFPADQSSPDLPSGNVSPQSPTTPGRHGTSQFDTKEIWRGNSSDWSRCHTALKTVRSDGRRLELWSAWLGDKGEQEEDMLAMKRMSNERKRGVRWTEDQSTIERLEHGPISHILTDEPLDVDSSRAPTEFLKRVLHDHAEDILATFVYPDSRAKFHDMLQRANLLDALPPAISFSISTNFRERLEA